MEQQRDEDKEGKEDDLDNETADDGIVARVDLSDGLGLGEHAAAGALGEEGDDVAEDKDFCEARGPDERVAFAVEDGHDAAEEHVDGGGEEGRAQEDHESLDYVGA